MKRNVIIAAVALLVPAAGTALQVSSPDEGEKHLTVIAIGDAGEKNGEQRSNGNLIRRMTNGEHDGGVPDVLLFLGDNFYSTGLNLPADEAEGKVKSILSPFQETMETLGPGNVHAIAGNHDYYTRNALETSALFGLISVEAGPYGLSDKGNQREKAIESWTYYYSQPGEAFYPVTPGSADSVHLLFFDSARLLRTGPGAWKDALRSLESLLHRSASRQHILWRVLSLHHPFVSLGEHGGYSEWNDETKTVEYLTSCDKDSNAVGWIKNLLDPEDLCAERYRQYVDSVRAAIDRSGAKIHLLLSGHDHSLQLLEYPAKDPSCEECPELYLISGAGAKSARVRAPKPPSEFTAFPSKADAEGESLTGFAQLVFSPANIRVRFFNGRRGEVIDMGGGKREFLVDPPGRLVIESP